MRNHNIQETNGGSKTRRTRMALCAFVPVKVSPGKRRIIQRASENLLLHITMTGRTGIKMGKQ